MLLITLLAGCVPLMLVVNLVEIGVVVGTDPRPVAVMKTDFELAGRLGKALDAEFAETAHVSVNAFDGVVLLSGEIPDDDAHARLAALGTAQPGVRRLHDETVVASPSTPAERATDTQLTARVKANIIAYASDSLDSMHLMVVTERRVVYLLGKTRPAYAEHAAIAARLVSGVQRVVVLVDTGAAIAPPVPNETPDAVEPPDDAPMPAPNS
ncbi:BON domain-containing protein [Jeongeupia naejangsanensis]|uniref:BON domain-containing protein n=1 Tax=Jeongeupia naejangsanensis TaxID=613195 RepID=A0ABS2BMT1_9NEIS|nr:BON domain-containing protein [Jeongeupia naejangsanensis]MBM3116089.1 BON domain-containing protein [Jeongeupia naejangsanensis]